jgi:hypothetical protein
VIPENDNLRELPYDGFMAAGAPYILVRLQTRNPIEIGDFVATFASVASQYDKFIRQAHPDLSPQAQLFVRQVKAGSIIVELLPFLPYALFGADQIVTRLEQINAVNEFVKTYGEKLSRYFQIGDPKVQPTTRSDLKDFMGSVEAIAKDPNGKATIQAVAFEDGKKKIKAAIRFNSNDAMRALEAIEAERRVLEGTDTADYQRVLMVFKQANVKGAQSANELVSGFRLSAFLIRSFRCYASELAEQRIKHEIAEADENVFRKGFVVDVNVEMRAGRPVAYRVTNLHQVIDLPNSDD